MPALQRRAINPTFASRILKICSRSLVPPSLNNSVPFQKGHRIFVERKPHLKKTRSLLPQTTWFWCGAEVGRISKMGIGTKGKGECLNIHTVASHSTGSQWPLTQSKEPRLELHTGCLETLSFDRLYRARYPWQISLVAYPSDAAAH